MLCRDLMNTKLECLSPNDSAQVAARKMRDINAGIIPICDNARKVSGTVTDRDLAIRVLADALPPTTPLQNIMSKDIVACRPTDPVERAQELMAKHHKSRILVTEQDGRLVGLISLSDIVTRADGPGAVQTLRQVAAREAHI